MSIHDDNLAVCLANPRSDHNGYKRCKVPGHPRADRWGFVYVHSLVVEAKLGRFLNTLEQVHHGPDANRHNNHPDNLSVCASARDHFALHSRKKPRIMVKCACGCGRERESPDRTGTDRRYIHGHNIQPISPTDV